MEKCKGREKMGVGERRATEIGGEKGREREGSARCVELMILRQKDTAV